ncbi:hypothetical protein M231_03854 [Tremella mesenterica]|uniref:Clu domain-containing protein n=1 Tax=Tremella mesenterica TaxID=5217 RepID=A0A4Q1BM70_TREME|nr:hypothetical protein M231_03854 [Tremella mesenterica]
MTEALPDPHQLQHVDDHVASDGLSPDQPSQHDQPYLVIVRLPAPNHPRTLPKAASVDQFSELRCEVQPYESIQDVKQTINDWVGGYWLGPYSLRLRKQQHTGQDGHLGSESTDPEVNERLSDWTEVGNIFGPNDGSEGYILDVLREPWTNLAARQAVLRLVDIIAPPGSSTHTLSCHIALEPGATIFEAVENGTAYLSITDPVFRDVSVPVSSNRKNRGSRKETVKIRREITADDHAFADWTAEWRPPKLSKLPSPTPPIPAQPCLKSIQLSSFNPPTPNLRHVGHHLYLQVTILEGETMILVCTTRGWYASKSSLTHFDPAPRPRPNGSASACQHSLFDLLHDLSPIFTARLFLLPPFSSHPAYSQSLATIPIPQAEPAYPWLVAPPKIEVMPDLLRTQLAFLHTGSTAVDTMDTSRDWNEEFQNIKELPQDSVQERAFRERLGQKTWGEFTAAAARSVLNIACGDVPPLNPEERPRAHMWLVNNIFITKALDSLNAYEHLGGDAATWVSHNKDCSGVKILNKLDISGVHVLGQALVDCLGERWVCQSVLPGIFIRNHEEEDEEKQQSLPRDSQPSPSKDEWIAIQSPPKSSSHSQENDATRQELLENDLIIYGVDTEQPGSLHWDASSHRVLERVAMACHLAKHPVKDGRGVEHEFWSSIEVKALRGTDGRRYLLDLFRLSPVDVEWLERDLNGPTLGPSTSSDTPEYPHRITLLRAELLQAFRGHELKRWLQSKSDQRRVSDLSTPLTGTGKDDGHLSDDHESPTRVVDGPQDHFDMRFNPDAFVDPPSVKSSLTETSRPAASAVVDEDEPSVKAVRDASRYLRGTAIRAMVLDVLSGSTSGIMDGSSLTEHLHQRGINMRYLGYLMHELWTSSTLEGSKDSEQGLSLTPLKEIVVQEMLFRSAKHILRCLVRTLRLEEAPKAISHFLNCLLGAAYNDSPKPEYEPCELFEESAPHYLTLTPAGLKAEIVSDVAKCYRWSLAEKDFQNMKRPQLLRELASRFAFQLGQRDYEFEKEKDGQKISSKPKDSAQTTRQTTFEPSDILSLIPRVKSTAPSVTVAEELLNIGRSMMSRPDLGPGLEVIAEAVQLYQSIHCVFHPEVASAYNTYASMIYRTVLRAKAEGSSETSADESNALKDLGVDLTTGIRLQGQACVIAERTVGIWHSDTAAYYHNLAMLESLGGNVHASLRFFRHALNIWSVVYGEGHPETITILNNAGVALETLKQYPTSLSLFLRAHQVTVTSFGPRHLTTAQSLHQLTQSYFVTRDFIKALESATHAHSIYEEKLGSDHAQTLELAKSVDWIKHVIESLDKPQAGAGNQMQASANLDRTTLATGGLSASDRLRAIRLRRLARDLPIQHGRNETRPEHETQPNVRLDGKPAEPGGQEVTESTSLGSKDLDELVRYIHGANEPKRGKHALRGKRRTGGKR